MYSKVWIEEVFITYMNLKKNYLWSRCGCCLDVEMPALVSLAHMELNGFGFSEDECERQRKIIVARLEELEQEAYRLAGRTFALTSPEDVCQVCFFSSFVIKERMVKVIISVSDNLISDHNSAYSWDTAKYINQRGVRKRKREEKIFSFLNQKFSLYSNV